MKKPYFYVCIQHFSQIEVGDTRNQDMQLFLFFSLNKSCHYSFIFENLPNDYGREVLDIEHENESSRLKAFSHLLLFRQ